MTRVDKYLKGHLL